jgi:hypothetical protein
VWNPVRGRAAGWCVLNGLVDWWIGESVKAWRGGGWRRGGEEG